MYFDVDSAKSLTENRVLMLTEKINNLKIGHRADAERKIDTLHHQVSELEEELEALVASSSNRHCELKHIVNGLQYSLVKFRRSCFLTLLRAIES